MPPISDKHFIQYPIYSLSAYTKEQLHTADSAQNIYKKLDINPESYQEVS